MLLLFYKATLPKRFFINRGNHESLVVNCVYGFMNDLEDKYATTLSLVLVKC